MLKNKTDDEKCIADLKKQCKLTTNNFSKVVNDLIKEIDKAKFKRINREEQ